MSHEEDNQDYYGYENYNGYYLGWAILILVLLCLLVCAGWLYIGHGDKHGTHGGSYLIDHSMSPGKGH